MTEEKDPLEPLIEILREPAELAPDFTQRVMAEIQRLPLYPVAPPPRQVPWWRREWTIRLSPLRGLGVAAGLAVLLLGAQFVLRRERPAATGVLLRPVDDQLTQFVLVAPGAQAVMLVGDFNDWSLAATPLLRAAGDGVWYVTVPLAPGRYRYAFVVDGRTWRSDPQAPGGGAEDEFGRANSVVTVGGA